MIVVRISSAGPIESGSDSSKVSSLEWPGRSPEWLGRCVWRGRFSKGLIKRALQCASMQVIHALLQSGSLFVLIKEIGLLFFPSEPIIHCGFSGQPLSVESTVNAKVFDV